MFARSRPGFVEALEGGAGLVEFLGNDAHHVETELRLIAQKLAQLIRGNEDQFGIFDDLGSETEGRIGERCGQPQHGIGTEDARGEAARIAVETKTNLAAHDQVDARYCITTTKENRPLSSLNSGAGGLQLHLERIGGNECAHLSSP
jgi:hypothetical protein